MENGSPALLISTSRPWPLPRTIFTASATEDEELTSSGKTVTLGRLCSSLGILEVLRAVAKTWWFSFFRERARAREAPMPPVEQPVMRIDLGILSLSLEVCLV